MRKIVLACGGTGGHIFPAFSTAEELKARYPDTRITYICGKKDIENAIFKMISHEKVYSVESAPFRGIKSLFSPSFLLKLSGGIRHSFSILKKEKPAVVVGFGGHYSFPVIAAAKLLRIPTMIHEQNVYPGMANKVLTRWVDGVALSFSQSKKYLPPHRNFSTTGNPIRAFIEKDCRQQALDFFNFQNEKVTMLVLGGSQGAESINLCYLEALKILAPDTRAKIQVVHLCGRMDPQEAEKTALAQGVRAKAFSFFERMDLAYGATDFAIGRAGATFLAEIRSKKIPAILVPYPFAGGHQLLNANAFIEDSASIVVEQSELNPEKLAEILENFIRHALEQRASLNLGDRIGESSEAFPPLTENSRSRLAEFIEECAGWK